MLGLAPRRAGKIVVRRAEVALALLVFYQGATDHDVPFRLGVFDERRTISFYPTGRVVVEAWPAPPEPRVWLDDMEPCRCSRCMTSADVRHAEARDLIDHLEGR